MIDFSEHSPVFWRGLYEKTLLCKILRCIKALEEITESALREFAEFYSFFRTAVQAGHAHTAILFDP